MDIVRKGRNAQAKHAPPKHSTAADYGSATGLEALWGMLYIRKQTERLHYLMEKAIADTEEIWGQHS